MWLENLKERDHLWDLNLDGKIILKFFLKMQIVTMWADLSGWRQ
jgi:hypothetical protein